MPQITINLDSKENKQIGIFKAKEELKSKEAAVKMVIRKFFKIKNTAINKKGWKR